MFRDHVLERGHDSTIPASRRAQVCEAAGALAPHAQCCHMAYKVSGKWAQGQLPQPAPVADAQATGTIGADDAQDSARSAAASPSGQQQENERASCNGARRCDGAAGVVKSSAEPAAAVAKAAVAQQAIAEAAPQPVRVMLLAAAWKGRPLQALTNAPHTATPTLQRSAPTTTPES